MYGNQLTGTIPPELGGLNLLKRLRIKDNPFSGALPSTLTALSLDLFWYDETDLCEPGDPAFQTWLGSIADLKRTDALCGPQTVGGTVWNDQNRDGIQDPGEPPTPDLTVTLSRSSGSLASIAAGRQVVTGSNGGYQFANVAAGAYSIAVANPSGYLPTVPGPVSITVQDGANVTVPPIGLAWAPVHVYLPLVRR